MLLISTDLVKVNSSYISTNKRAHSCVLGQFKEVQVM